MIKLKYFSNYFQAEEYVQEWEELHKSAMRNLRDTEHISDITFKAYINKLASDSYLATIEFDIN